MRLIPATLLLVFLALPCSADVIAHWRFEPDDPGTPQDEFILDSSGNHHSLTNNGVHSIPDIADSSGGNGSAGFDGYSFLNTVDTLDLSPYRTLRLTWQQQVIGPETGMIWEHSPNFINNPGAIVCDVYEGKYGATGRGLAGVWTASAHNLDGYPHAHDMTWEAMAVEINLDAVRPENIVRVYRNGELVVDGGTNAYDVVPFIDDVFFIGARGSGEGDLPDAHFIGMIDELKIEDTISSDPVPEDLSKVYILSGQSNAVGQYAPSAELPTELQAVQEDVQVCIDGYWTPLQPGLGTATVDDFGPEITFGRTLADAMPEENVALIKHARGATTLAVDWDPENPNGLYDGLIADVNASMAEVTSQNPDGELAGMIWMQGESDAFTLEYAQAYETNLREFIESVREDVGVADLPFVIGKIPPDPVWTHYDLIRQAQENVAASMENVSIISTDDLPVTSHHYNATGQQMLGERFADAILDMAGIGLEGDVNGDGHVNSGDLDIVRGNWGLSVSGPGEGDLSGDGMVGSADLDIVRANWGAASAAAVPEPASLVLVLCGLGLLTLRRHCFANRRILMNRLPAIVICLSCLTSVASAEVIAFWQFEADDPGTPENEFLADSSGNGHVLENHGAFCTPNFAGSPGGDTNAGFNGEAYLKTAETLDLSGYDHLRISWRHRVVGAGGIIWEHSPSFIGKSGAIVADVNDPYDNGVAAGKAGIWIGSSLNLDNYPHSHDFSWENQAVEIDLTNDVPADIVKVFRDDVLISTASTAQAKGDVSFLNDYLFIGARGGTGVFLTGLD